MLTPLISEHANPPSMPNTLPMGSMSRCQRRNYVILKDHQHSRVVQMCLQRKCVDASAHLEITLLMTLFTDYVKQIHNLFLTYSKPR